jgi:hypothetical protein
LPTLKRKVEKAFTTSTAAVKRPARALRVNLLRAGRLGNEEA